MQIFTPPTVTYRIGSDPLFGRINHQRGLAVVVYGSGLVQQKPMAPSVDGAEVVAVYSSGRHHTITDEEAAVLSAAGYDDYLEAVT